MKNYLIISAFLVSPLGVAQAGPCADRISQLERTLTEADAGAGPTNAPAAPTSSSASTTPKAGEAPGTDGTSAMNAAVGNRATSPGDVRAQQSGTPTAAQGGASTSQMINDALARAKRADAAGDGQSCGKSLDEAEKLMKS